MSDSDGKKTLGLRGNSARSGNVKQSFSHGRTKNVVVETKRKRVVVPKPGAGKSSSGGVAGDPSKRPAGISDAEMERRLKAVQAAKAREVEETAKRAAEEKARAEERDRRRAEQETKEREEREREAALKAKQEEEAQAKKAAEDAARRAAEQAKEAAARPAESRPAPSAKPSTAPARRDREREDQRSNRGRGDDGGRRSGKLTLNQALSGAEGGRQRSMAAMKRKQERARQKAMGGAQEREKVVRNVQLPEAIMVSELANRMSERVADVVKALMTNGIMATQNQTIDADTAELIIEEFGHEVTRVSDADVEDVIETAEDNEADLKNRPPVITIMGHVDHGKTSLLDYIRDSKVTEGEAGGITQHIGAYDVMTEGGKRIAFLDTPGHEAFTAMRARGTRVTDIAILVVAADDGVRPQTIEAIRHAQAAEVPILVAINKIDKESAQPDRVKQELMEHSLVPEEWGGETIMVPVSALNGENLDSLLEMILLVSEVEDLYANPDRPAKGTVIEANLDKARGPVATLLVQNGTLRIGDSIVVGSVFGKVRAMIDDRLQRVEEATPSFAVEVLGLSDVPAAGDEFDVFYDEKEARSVANQRADQQRLSRLQQAMASRRVSLNTLSAQAQEGDLKELNLILKADVQGSVEAILASLQQLPQDEVQVRVLFAAPGEISETDVDLAAASNAVIIGFNTTLASGARQAADRAGVDIRDYDIIYKLLEDIEGAMEGLLEPELVEEALGEVEVRAVFPVGRGAVAGCYVLSGKAIRNCRIRVNRDGDVVFEGNLDSLKRVKDDVKEVNAGYECGIGIDNFAAWQEGDRIETFKMVTKRRKLASATAS